VSTSEEAASGLGIEAQKDNAIAYAERKGFTIISESRQRVSQPSD